MSVELIAEIMRLGFGLLLGIACGRGLNEMGYKRAIRELRRQTSKMEFTMEPGKPVRVTLECLMPNSKWWQVWGNPWS